MQPNRNDQTRKVDRYTRDVKTRRNEAQQILDRYLRLPEVERVKTKKKSSIYAGMAAGTFPRCVRLSARAVAWRESDIAAWQAQREQVGAQS